MALELLNFLLDGLVSFVDGVSFVLFKGAAAALMLFLSVLKLPGCVLFCLLCHVRRGTEELLQFAADSLADAAASLADSGGRAAAGSLDSVLHILKDAAAYLGEVIESAVENVPELVCGAAAAAATAAAKMVASVAANFLEAAKDLSENGRWF